MEEQLVSLQTARLAKSKGFNEPTLTGFHGSKIHDVLYSDVLEGLTKYNTLKITYEGVNIWTSAPTQSLLQRWLREVHKIHIQLSYEIHMKWFYGVNKAPYAKNDEIISYYDNDGFESYELALEDALLNALKLIK